MNFSLMAIKVPLISRIMFIYGFQLWQEIDDVYLESGKKGLLSRLVFLFLLFVLVEGFVSLGKFCS